MSPLSLDIFWGVKKMSDLGREDRVQTERSQIRNPGNRCQDTSGTETGREAKVAPDF
jgi:hypothetical protein